MANHKLIYRINRWIRKEAPRLPSAPAGQGYGKTPYGQNYGK